MKKLFISLSRSRASRKGSAFYSDRSSWDFAGMFLGNQRRWLFDPLLAMVRMVTNVSTRKWHRVIWAYLNRLFALYRASGLRGLVLYLKTAQLLLMQSQAGMVIRNSRTLGAPVARNRTGVPLIIPALHRARIRDGDRNVLRVWVSLLSLYRVLSFPGVLKLETIVGEGISFSLSAVYDFVGLFWAKLYFVRDTVDSITDYVFNKSYDERTAAANPTGRERSLFGARKSTKEFVTSWATKYLQAKPFMIWKSSCFRGSVSGSPGSVVITAGMIFRRSLSVWKAITEWLRLTGNQEIAEFMKLSESTAEMLAGQFAGVKHWLYNEDLGRLSVKAEPAGKLRVFAIVDPWTQWLMRPLHKQIQKTLKRIPQDGTFDQLAPIRRLMVKFGGSQTCYSYDLSAATDRLPISIQEIILSTFIGTPLAIAWSRLLVGRRYLLPNPKHYDHASPQKSRRALPGLRETSVKYAVGQPMGALSSWVMLALTHHFIVQMAANNVRPECDWYEGYAVLGDDLVIIDTDVADEYLRLMDGVYGVKINVHKSLVSHQGVTLEFAKRYFLKGQDCTPRSFKELAESRWNISVWLEMGRKYGLSSATLLNLAGFPAKKSRYLSSKFKLEVGNPKGRKAWDVRWCALFFREYVRACDARSALFWYGRDLRRRITRIMDSWNQMLFMPDVSEFFRKRRLLGEQFVAEANNTVNPVFIAKAPSVIRDFLSAHVGFSNIPVKAVRSFGWSKMASELLYATKTVYFQSILQQAIRDLDSLEMFTVYNRNASAWEGMYGHVETVSKDVSSVPMGIEDYPEKRPPLERRTLAEQARVLRNLWNAAQGKERVVRGSNSGDTPTAKSEGPSKDGPSGGSPQGDPQPKSSGPGVHPDYESVLKQIRDHEASGRGGVGVLWRNGKKTFY